MGFFDGLKKGASDLFAVGQQVAGMTLDAGLAALNGAKTLITDPKKFVEDTAHSVSELGRHAANSFSDGAVMIGDGWNADLLVAVDNRRHPPAVTLQQDTRDGVTVLANIETGHVAELVTLDSGDTLHMLFERI